MKLKCYRIREDVQKLVPGRTKRTWMDAITAYRCTPLSMANGTGWELLSPCRFSAVWNGRPGKNDIIIEALDDYPHLSALARSHFGHGILSFFPSYLFTTDPGWTLWVRGAPNSPKDGVQPLDGLVETDWLPFRFSMNWKFTRPGRIIFERDEPFCFLTPLPHKLVETVQPEISSIESNPELNREYLAWTQSRETFLKDLANGDPNARAQGWQKFYLNGRSALGTPAETDHQNKRRLAEPLGLTSPDHQVTASDGIGPLDGECEVNVTLHDQSITLGYPAEAAADIHGLFFPSPGQRESAHVITVSKQSETEEFSVTRGDGTSRRAGRSELPVALIEEVESTLITGMRSAIALRAGYVTGEDGALLVVGRDEFSRSAIIAWLADRGFRIGSESVTVVPNGTSELTGLRSAMLVDGTTAQQITALSLFADARAKSAGNRTLLTPPPAAMAPGDPLPCKLIVFAEHDPDTSLSIETTSSGRAALELMRNNLNAHLLAEGGVRFVGALSRSVPTLSMRFGGMDQLDGALDVLALLVLRNALEVSVLQKFLSLLPRRANHFGNEERA